MKAAVCSKYGPPDVVKIEDWANPEPKAGEVLVSIEAAGLTSGDARIRGARAPGGMGPLIRLAFGLTGPRRPVLGREYAGRVAALGAGVKRFQIGDAVFGITDGMTLGGHAEYVAVKENGLIFLRPETLSTAEAAAFFFGGLTAADFLLDQCKLTQGEHVLVVGATGAVGSAAIQIAKHYGAHITAMSSSRNLDLAIELGAHSVIDYQKEKLKGFFDVIIDAPGVLTNGLDHLAPGGRLGIVTADLYQMLSSLARPARTQGRKIYTNVVKETHEAASRLMALNNIGAYRPLLGESFHLNRIVDAYAAADTGHKRGNLVINIR